jgi:peptide/nickel transport system ATP-binding protein
MNNKPILKVENLCVDFSLEKHNIRAVDHISFNLHQGETLGIVGESGSGKSVSSLSIMQLIASPGKISSGNILFKNKNNWINLSSLEEKKLRNYRGKKIAMIFQEPMTSLNPVYTCGKQITEAIILHQNISKSKAHQQTIELFNEVLLPRPKQIFKNYPHQLSGGQKQRVMIAMALSCRPDILIADEPTTALDVTVQKSILDLLKKLQEKYNMSIIFITHDLSVIAEIADNVLVMFEGKIVEQGKITSIFNNPQHPYTKGLIACRPSLERNQSKLLTISDFINAENEDSINNLISSVTLKNKESVNQLIRKYGSGQVILKVQNISTYFPLNKKIFSRKREYIKAVDNVSFDVYPSETLGLVGESGCGKTTLGRTIIRLIEPTYGWVYYKNENITGYSKSQLRQLRKDFQIIFQDPYSSLNPRKTVGNTILEPMQVHNLYEKDHIRKEKSIELLERVQLEADHFNRYPHELSGGQRQRVCIARALSLNPKFIICDESVSALDVSVQAHVLNLLSELKEEYMFTYIFISHDLSVVKHMSDRMAVMNNGEIVEIGDTEKIYNNPQEEYTKRLIDAVPKGIVQ